MRKRKLFLCFQNKWILTLRLEQITSVPDAGTVLLDKILDKKNLFFYFYVSKTIIVLEYCRKFNIEHFSQVLGAQKYSSCPTEKLIFCHAFFLISKRLFDLELQ